MPRLKLHFDGWLSLPAHFRQQLGLDAGDALEAELVEGTIVLRPSKGSAKAVQEGRNRRRGRWLPTPPRPCQLRRFSRPRCESLGSRSLRRRHHQLPSVVADHPRPKLRPRHRDGSNGYGG